jgi:hypothetical protein
LEERKMRSSKRMFLACVVMMGIAVTNSNAALEVLQNPCNMEVKYYQEQTGNWYQWATDTLTTAALAGTAEVIDHGGYWLGNPNYMVDGVVTDWVISPDIGCEFWKNSFVDFKFKSTYTGGRTLGFSPEGGNAIRVHTNCHVDHDGFWYMLQYSTTDSPTVFHTLIEVRDLAVQAWAPKLVLCDFGLNSTLVKNVDTIRYVQLDEGHQGLVEELNINMIPEPATITLLAIGIVGAVRRMK